MRSALLLRKSHPISEHREKKRQGETDRSLEACLQGNSLGPLRPKIFFFLSSFHVQVIPEIRLRTYRADKGLGFGSTGTLKKRRMKLCQDSKKTYLFFSFYFTNLNKSSVRFKTDTNKNPLFSQNNNTYGTHQKCKHNLLRFESKDCHIKSFNSFYSHTYVHCFISLMQASRNNC